MKIATLADLANPELCPRLVVKVVAWPLTVLVTVRLVSLPLVS